jgi:hypothetical protein
MWLDRGISVDQISSEPLSRGNWCPTEWQLHLIPRKAYKNAGASMHRDMLLPTRYPPSLFQWRGKSYWLFSSGTAMSVNVGRQKISVG